MRKETKVKFVGLLVGIFLAFMLLELLIQIFDPSSRSFARVDEILGWSLIPNAYYKSNPLEGCPGWGSEGYINLDGLRDYEYDYLKPAKTFRILALGDSTTEGFQHPLADTWTKLLEKQLNDREDGYKYEVINAGMGGYGTAHEYLFYTHEGYRYSPDLVILLFNSNDISDNSKELSLRLVTPYFKINDDKLVLDNSFSQSSAFKFRSKISSIIEPLKTKSYLISFLLKVYNLVFRNNNKTDVNSEETNDLNLTGEKGSNNSDILEAIRVTQQLLVELNQSVSKNGAHLVVFNIDDKSIAGPGKLDQLLTDIAEAQEISYYDLFPSMDQYSQSKGVYLFGCAENNGEGHWSQAGHALASKLMNEFLLFKKLLP